MDNNMTLEMKKNIDGLIKEKRLVGKRVVVFGSNQAAEEIVDYLIEQEVMVDALVDNSEKKIGMKMKEIDIHSPEDYLRPFVNETIILIASKYYPEMVLQLEAMGYKEQEHIIKVVEYNRHSSNVLSDDEFEKRVEIVIQGEKYYSQIKKNFPELDKIFVCPLTILGDTYVSVACLHDYLSRNHIHNYIILVASKACYKVVDLFGFDNILQLDSSNMESFVQYSIFSKKAMKEIYVLHHRVPYTCKIGDIGNYKDINFMDHFRYSIFGLPEGTLPETPMGHRDDSLSKEYVNAFFEKNKLKRNKTVILIPYANTVSDISVHMWEKITEVLLEKGYDVCTNCDGSTQQTIKGTKPVFFDLTYCLEVVEAAGVLIGLRCGLCDVLSTAKCKKIILYPDRIYGPDSFMKFFGLKNMQLCEDVKEILLDEQESVEAIIEDL